MALDELYEIFLRKSDITPSEIGRIGRLAIKEEAYFLLGDALAHRSCPEDLIDFIKKSDNSTVLRSWLDSPRCTKEDFKWFVSHHDTETILGAYNILGGYNKSRMDTLWKKNDTELRLFVLHWTAWHGKKLPLKQATWFFKTLKEENFAEPSDVVLQNLQTDSTLNPFWDAAVLTDDLQNMSILYLLLENEEISETGHIALATKVEKELQWTDINSETLEVYYPIVLKNVEYSKAYMETSGQAKNLPGCNLGAQMLALLPKGSEQYMELSYALSFGKNKVLAPGKEQDFVAELQKGTLSEAAVTAAGNVSSKKSEHPLWRLAAQHPDLTTSQGAMLLSQGKDQSKQLNILTAGRSVGWAVELAKDIWQHESYNDTLGPEIFKLLPLNALEEAITNLMESDYNSIGRLVHHEVHAKFALRRVKLSTICWAGAYVQENLVDLAREVLEDNQAAWEVFETLIGFSSDDFLDTMESSATSTSPTFGEILDTSLQLAKNPGK